MRYNRYLYRLPVQAVPITDIVKNSISSADIVTDPIIGTSLILTHTNLILPVVTHSKSQCLLVINTSCILLHQIVAIWHYITL